jgi:hypothetical protein
MRLFRGKAKPKSDQEDEERMPETDTEASPAAATDELNAASETEPDTAPSDTTPSDTIPAATPEPDTNEAETAADVPEKTPPPQDNLLAQIGAEADAELAKEEAAAAEDGSPTDKDELDPELLDIFRDARNEVQEGSLAAELEDIAVQELLNELVGVSSRLGIAAQGPARDRAHESTEADEPSDETPEASEPSAETPAADEPSAQSPTANEPSTGTPGASAPHRH